MEREWSDVGGQRSGGKATISSEDGRQGRRFLVFFVVGI